MALRYFNDFGSRQDPGSEYSAVIPKFIRTIKAGGAPTIFGDGEQTRDFSFIDNVVQANLRACEAGEEAFGLAFNIACGERISLNDLVSQLAAFAGRAVTPVHAEARAGDIRHSLAGIERAQRVLGYRPAVDVREGLRRTWDAY